MFTKVCLLLIIVCFALAHVRAQGTPQPTASPTQATLYLQATVDPTLHPPIHPPTYGAPRPTDDPTLPRLTAIDAYDLIVPQVSLYWRSEAQPTLLLGRNVTADGTATAWLASFVFIDGDDILYHDWIARPGAVEDHGERALLGYLYGTQGWVTVQQCPACNPADLYPLPRAFQTAKQLAVSSDQPTWADPITPIAIVMLVDGTAFDVEAVWVFDFVGLQDADVGAGRIVVDAQTGEVLYDAFTASEG